MHELSVTENILNIALQHAEKAQAKKITNVYLVIGDLSSIVDDSVQFYWDFITEGTIAAEATLHFRRIATEMSCVDCGHHYHPQNDLGCPLCQSIKVEIIAGEEFYLDAIDIEESEVLA